NIFQATQRMTKYQGRGIYFALFKEDGPNRYVLEKGEEGFSYLGFQFSGEIATRPHPIPENILILWDASASAKNRKKRLDYDFLEQFHRKYPQTTFDVQVLQYPLPRVKEFGKEIKPLIEHLQSQVDDGGSLIQWPENVKDYDEVWYFGDGKPNLQ